MWGGTELHVCQALAGQYVGLKPIEDGQWLMHFCQTPIAVFDEKALAIHPWQEKQK